LNHGDHRLPLMMWGKHHRRGMLPDCIAALAPHGAANSSARIRSGGHTQQSHCTVVSDNTELRATVQQGAAADEPGHTTQHKGPDVTLHQPLLLLLLLLVVVGCQDGTRTEEHQRGAVGTTNHASASRFLSSLNGQGAACCCCRISSAQRD
jgi:hypothetical protein